MALLPLSAVLWLTFILPRAGPRQIAAINSNRWAGRPLSQRIHRTDWTPPDPPEQRSGADKISQYSKQDYVIGESSAGMLQKIAHRLNNGPSPAQILPEIDSSDIESEMAEMSRQKSAAVELDGNFFAVELDAGPNVWPPDSHPSETASSRASEEKPRSQLSGPFSKPQDVQGGTESAPPSDGSQANTGSRKWEGGFF